MTTVTVDTYGPQVKASELQRFLKQTIAYNARMGEKGSHKRKIVPCIWGPPGIGKTSIVKQLFDEDTVVIDIPLAQFEEMGDLHGLPRRESKNGVEFTSYAPPQWVPQTNDKKYIILFDDWNRADIRIIKGCMQLLQNYGTVSWSFPASATIMLTGNPDDGDNLVSGVDTAIMTRIRHIQLTPDPLVWAEWAKDSDDVDERIINFVLRYKEMFNPGPNKRTNPRTLTEFGEFLKGSPNLNEKDVRLHARAALDDEVSVAFDKFLKNELEFLIDPKEILEGKWDRDSIKRLAKEGKTDIIHTIIDRLYVELSDARRTEKRVTNFQEFLTQDGVPRDMVHSVCSRLVNHEKKHEWVKGDKLSDIMIEVVS